MENSIKNQLEESRKDGTLKETLQGMGFNRLQSVEIAKGLNNEVDITKYADKKYDAAQMKSIRLALEEGMDITPFADNRYNYMQMEEIKAVIREHMDLDAVCNPAYDYSVMKEIRLSERMNYDITKYAKRGFSGKIPVFCAPQRHRRPSGILSRVLHGVFVNFCYLWRQKVCGLWI